MHEKHIDGYCVHMKIQRLQKQIQVQNNKKKDGVISKKFHKLQHEGISNLFNCTTC
jgi:hypothetical protein